jgi:hypothetical protein
MRQIIRWTLAVLALAGFHSVAAQAQSHHNLTNPDHMDALNSAAFDLNSYEVSDGYPSP